MFLKLNLSSELILFPLAIDLSDKNVNSVGFEVLSGGYEEYCRLGYNTVYAVECQPTFRRKIEVILSSETSVDTQRTAWRCIPEDGTLREMLVFILICHKN
jgi:hypothetical protein